MNFYFHSSDTRKSFYGNPTKNNIFNVRFCDSLLWDNQSIFILGDLIKSLNYVRPTAKMIKLRIGPPFESLVTEFLCTSSKLYPPILDASFSNKGMIITDLGWYDPNTGYFSNQLNELWIWDGMDVKMIEKIETTIEKQTEHLQAVGYTDLRFFVLNTFTERIYPDSFYMEQLMIIQ